MNPSDEAPESHVNGQTSQVRPSSSATVKAKPRPKKGNSSLGSKLFLCDNQMCANFSKIRHDIHSLVP